MWRRMLLAVLAVVCLTSAVDANEPPVEDFTFVQFTDLHLSPYLERMGKPPALRGGETIEWICREAVGPRRITPWELTTTAPAFALVTGDITEYGVIDETWEEFEKAFAPLPYPLYVLPGNHDNTWVAMYHIMRQRHGGENYSFDKFGCHFACISSASPQEPVPTIDAKTRTWLKRDLDSIPPGMPVFVALHHPPNSGEFAPAESDTLLDFLRDYNVVLVLYGHGHGVVHRDFEGIDGVMGGSTFGKNAGYAVICVQDEMLRVAYRYREPRKVKGEDAQWQALLEKPIRPCVAKRLFRIASPKSGEVVSGDEFELVLELAEGITQIEQVSVSGAGEEYEVTPVEGSASDRPAWRVPVKVAESGWRNMTVRGQSPDGSKDLDTVAFRIHGEQDRVKWRREFAAAIKAAPVIVGEKLIIARTDGVVVALERDSGKEVWSFETGGEVLGTPAWGGSVLVFGSGDGKIYALDGGGKLLWKHDAGVSVYGVPLIESDTVYIGDNGGRMHALDLNTGKPRWMFSRADYSIECQPCLWDGLLVFGAWDGYLYALDKTSGKQAWKVLGPKSSAGKAARYYAPADCGPVPLGESLFVCDRGYLLGTYGRDGTLLKQLADDISAIAVDSAGLFIYGRSTKDRVCKYNAVGEQVWTTAVAAGRFPIPPVCCDGAVYVCSNTGLLSVLDAADGSVRWNYQVTPGFYVMAPPAVDERGVCYVAGMEGSLTALMASGK